MGDLGSESVHDGQITGQLRQHRDENTGVSQPQVGPKLLGISGGRQRGLRR